MKVIFIGRSLAGSSSRQPIKTYPHYREDKLLEIRRYRPEDNPTVKALLRACLPQMDPTGAIRRLNIKLSTDIDDIDNIYLKNGVFLVGCEGDKIVAMGAFKRKTDTCAEFKRLRVHPDYQHQGYGEAITLKLLELAAQMGYTEAFLDMLPDNSRSRALAEKMGFIKSGQGNWNNFDLHYYTKKLV